MLGRASTPDSAKAKQHSLRMPLDYYQGEAPLVRAKWLLAAAAGVLSFIYLGWLFAAPAGREHASPGPVAAAHVAWDDDCAKCHEPLRPLRSDALNLAALLRGHVGEGSAEAHRQAADQKCTTCHTGPAHQSNTIAGEVPTCAACHRDHQGRGANLVRAGDANCLSCHRQIALHREAAKKSRWEHPIENVTGFGPIVNQGNAPHPPFHSLETGDPGNIKFNHWLHLQPGLAPQNAWDAKKKHLEDIEQSRRSRYDKFAEQGTGLLKLECSACHEPANRKDGDPASGDYMQPINFEQHCKDCHQLNLDLASGQPPAEGREDQAAPAQDAGRITPLPHGLKPERLRAELDGFLLRALKPEKVRDQVSIVPGRTLGMNLAEQVRGELRGLQMAAYRSVDAMCQVCHYPEGSASNSDELTTFLPSHINTVWFRHARFDHSAHRAVVSAAGSALENSAKTADQNCRLCHDQVFDPTPRMLAQVGYAKANDDAEVMIAGQPNDKGVRKPARELCAECHAPSPTGYGKARHDCAECHLYHGRDSMGPPLPHPAPQQTDAQPAPVADLVSCVSSGCHGGGGAGSPSRKAFQTWQNFDPHARAYDVLLGDRAREMTRLLSDDRPDSKKWSEAEHFKALQNRCVGCHETPVESVAQSASDRSFGVSCQSCHGPADDWLHTHYLAGFRSRPLPPTFTDTTNLSARAAVCMPCHVGPSSFQDQVVDHDLIAAGHPRLAFEFHAYFESLPAHWNRFRDENAHKDFHWGSWLAGQQAQQAQISKLHAMFSSAGRTGGWDFALLDCAACHHALAPTTAWRQRIPSDQQAGAGLAAQLTGMPGVESAPFVTASDLPKPSALTASEKVGDLFCTLSTASGKGRASWNRAVAAYLAARAILADSSPAAQAANTTENANDLRAALDRLGRYLAAGCFGEAAGQPGHWPSQYDLPTEFDPRHLAVYVDAVLQAAGKTCIDSGSDNP